MSYQSQATSKRNPVVLFTGLAWLLLGLFVANVGLGSVLISFGDLFQILTGSSSADPVLKQIVVDFRLPQALTALLSGSALSASGLLMQTIFRNPLADPFVLGVNSGASLGVAIVILVVAPAGLALTEGLGLSGNLLVVVAASTGSAGVLLLILILARSMDVMSILILGLMISYGVGAVVSLLMFFSMPTKLQSFITWSFGNFGNVTWSQLSVFLPVILIGTLSTLLLSKPLDALLMGENYAASLGTHVRRIRFFCLLAASVLAGTVTGFCGPIGFLGIAAPHLCRYLFQTSAHRLLIPASLIAGASLALGADLIAKAPGYSTVLPLNAITALFGAPVIIVALIKQGSLRNLFGK
ncbi:MAG: iron ABC transporter permease [Verrucomicrobia bacterium]|nr:iron ABC transporter permease [Verrucomicrobiota bacterium]MDA1067821.1 iron ABC transporter permease [Verrucomicrobiota bacterium]